MIAGLFKAFLFLFIICVLIVGFGLFKIINRVNNTFQKFGQENSHNNSKSQRRGGDNDEIIDTRSQKQTDRKIFSKDEGEYVDYKEV